MKYSFVIPCYNSAKTIGDVVFEIDSTMSSHNCDQYEIILVHDASGEDTLKELNRIVSVNARVMRIDLAKNFGQHAALMAGYNHASGEFIVSLDDDGQTPANEVFKLLDKLSEGYDVVFARYSHKKHHFFRNVGSRINDLMAEILINKPKDLYISSYFVAKRFVIDEMIRYKNPYPYISGLLLRTTNFIANVDINHRSREVGQSNYSFKKLIGLWLNGFTAFSVKPLRISMFMGVLCALFGFLLAVYSLINKMMNPDVVVGWTSTIAAITGIGGMILIVLGMIGEYVGRIYISLNENPQYVIRDVRGMKDD